MKLFQRLLVAPAALGLMAPMAATAADLNVRGVSTYSSADEQVTSISQFSDVYPTDWAYQALSNLIERYGCVAGYPSGSYLGNRAMTRYEAAALLNACLDRITEVTDEIRRLLNEFETELAVLRGRVDGLEARVGELEATQFSSTTKLRGTADMVIGGTSYSGDKTKDITDGTEALTFNYTLQLDLDTSFTGKDLLYARLKTGNFKYSAFSGKTYVKPAYLSVANSNQDTLKLDKLWYTFPIGDSFTAWVGAKIENYYMLGSAPSIYRQILKAFKLGGNYGVYGASTGQGLGLAWKSPVDNAMDPRIGISANYVAKYGYKGDSSAGGVGNGNSKGKFLAKLDYGNPQWQVSAAYAYTQQGM
ncbi:MAG: iron uptake porin, partial [Gammaproteobacteria bacterium]|nr:iron uptake porin [Gammaproteobacteria bacterium]